MTKKIIYSLAILFTILFAVSSCKKEVDKKADDDIAASVAGQYEMNYISINGQGGSLPTDSISGEVDVIKKDQNKVTMNLSLTKLGQEPEEDALEDIELKEENSSIGLYSGTDKIGTISGSNLEISVAGNGTELIIRAKK